MGQVVGIDRVKLPVKQVKENRFNPKNSGLKENNPLLHEIIICYNVHFSTEKFKI